MCVGKIFQPISHMGHRPLDPRIASPECIVRSPAAAAGWSVTVGRDRVAPPRRTHRLATTRLYVSRFPYEPLGNAPLHPMTRGTSPYRTGLAARQVRADGPDEAVVLQEERLDLSAAEIVHGGRDGRDRVGVLSDEGPERCRLWTSSSQIWVTQQPPHC